MTMDVELGPAAAVGEATVAGLSDQRCLQRAPTREIVVLRPLGEGAYSWVDLVALPVRPAPTGRPGAQRPYKLCAGKLLIPEPPELEALINSSNGNGSEDSAVAAAAAAVTAAAAATQPGCALARWTASAEASRGPVKPTPPCAFAKQKTAHAACAGSPFVVQLLACKQGRAGHMLLLLEFAEHGSLADFLPDDEEEGLTMHEEDTDDNNGAVDVTAAAAAAVDSTKAAAEAGGAAAEGAIAAAVAGLAPVTPEPQHDCGCGPAGRRSAKHAKHAKRRPAAAVEEEGSSSGCESGSGSGFASRSGSFSERTASGVLGEDAAAVASLGNSSSTISSSTVSSSSNDLSAAPVDGEPQPSPQQPDGPTPAMPDGRASPTPTSSSGGMPEEAARFYAACTLEALSHLHARSVLHRDVKPANLLLFSSGYLKLSDLGAACVVPPGHAPTTRSGTAAFMSPECKAARPQCAAADMWSLGVTLWQLVAGRLPAWAEEEGGHSGLEFPEHFSEDLRSLLAALLRHDPRDRPTVEATRHHSFFKGLDWQALREQRLAPPPVPPRPAPRERERRLLRRRCARCGGLRAVTAAMATGGGEGTTVAFVDASAAAAAAIASAAVAAPAAE